MNYKEVRAPSFTVLSIVIDQVAEGLASVNNSNTITYDFKCDFSLGSSIIRFERFYTDLVKVLRKRSGNMTDSETDTPPLPTTVPPHLRHTSPSIASTISTASTSSRESGPEHLTDDLANDFLWACLQTFQNQLASFAWYPKNYELHTMLYSIDA